MKKWTIIGNFFKKNGVLTLASFFTGFFYNIVTALIPISFGRFYEFNFGFSSHRLKLLKGMPFINTKEFNHFILFFIGLIFIRFIFEYANRYLISIIGERFAKDLRESLFAHQLSLNQKIYEEKGVGKYLLRYTGDFSSIKKYLTKGVLKFAQDILLILLLITVSISIHPEIGVIIAVFIFLAFTLLFFLNKILYKSSLVKRNTHSGFVSYLSKSLSKVLTIKAFNKATPITKRYNKRSLKLYKAGVAYQNIYTFIYAIVPMLTYLMIAAVMTYIHIKQNETTKIDQASLLILILVIITFLPIFRRVLKINVVWKLGNISFSKLFNIYNLDTESSKISTVKFRDLPISFHHIIYEEEQENALHFTIQPNSITLLKVSSSTSLASEIIKLLIKIHQPIEGSITVGNYEYENLPPKTIRKQIAAISPILLPLEGKTVFKAIAYNRKKETRQKAQAILNELQQFIPIQHHLSLDDKIGENSTLISQRQALLLMWCRLLLTKKRVFIIHDGLDGLNPELKNYLIQLLKTYKKRKTIVFIQKNKPTGITFQKEILF